MSNGIYVGASSHVALEKQLETVSSNLANADTTGFKKNRTIFSEYLHQYSKNEISEKMRKSATPQDKHFVEINEVTTDFSQGGIQKTENPLDLAVSGDGFFTVREAGEELLQRSGRFTLDSEGVIVAEDGAELLDENGNTIAVDPNFDINITSDGAVLQNNAEIAKIEMKTVNDKGWLEKTHKTRYKIHENADVVPAEVNIMQGYLEKSNVNPIEEMVKMIKVHRHYDVAAKAVKSYEEMDSKANNAVGDV